MGTSPKISIVIPAYNSAGFIAETIESVLNQNYPNLELIVIDGGSSDGTVDIIKRYEKQLAFWMTEKDRGAADAIRKGFLRATGDIQGALMSDDLYLPGALQAIADAFADSPDADVIYGNTYWVDGQNNRIGERRQTPFTAMGYLYGASDLQEPATFWTRDIYIRSGGFDPEYKFAFDTALFFGFVKAGARFKHTNKFLASFRIHPTSKSSNEFDLCATEVNRLRETHLPFPFRSLRATGVRLLARVQRTFWYFQQGDLFWLLGRIPDRLRSRTSGVIVGPRARSV